MALARMAPFVLLLLLSASAFGLSNAGGPCNATAQCSEGYCRDGACLIPTVSSYIQGGPCVKTADCGEGYCSAGICILPTARDELLQIGMKSGCAGLGEQAGVFGSLLCEAVWFLVPIFAIAAAYVSNRSGNSRIVTAAALILPIFIALLFFAFFGVLVAIAEMALLLGRRKYS